MKSKQTCDLLLLEDHKDPAADTEQQDEADDRTDDYLQQPAVLCNKNARHLSVGSHSGVLDQSIKIYQEISKILNNSLRNYITFSFEVVGLKKVKTAI